MTNILKNLIAFTLKRTVDDGSDVIWFDLFWLRMREMRKAIGWSRRWSRVIMVSNPFAIFSHFISFINLQCEASHDSINRKISIIFLYIRSFFRCLSIETGKRAIFSLHYSPTPPGFFLHFWYYCYAYLSFF